MIHRKLSHLRELRNKGEIQTNSLKKSTLCVIGAEIEPQLHVKKGNIVIMEIR
jgi:hypothetical protein